MQVKEIMTANPACCSPDTSLKEVAKKMVECDCGEIPVLDQNQKPIGVVTDRDIVCRVVAKGENPLDWQAKDCMTTPVVTIDQNEDVDSCCNKMEENLIRRVVVTDEQGSCCGILSQADIAEKAGDRETAEVLKEVSRPTQEASHVH